MNYLIEINNIPIGEAVQDVDGNFYFWPKEQTGALAAWALREIAKQLDNLNNRKDLNNG
jgi:hypothetical protein